MTNLMMAVAGTELLTGIKVTLETHGNIDKQNLLQNTILITICYKTIQEVVLFHSTYRCTPDTILEAPILIYQRSLRKEREFRHTKMLVL